MNLDEILERFACGDPADFKGHSVPASALSSRISAAALDSAGPIVLTAINAKISGHLLLDGIGQKGRPLTLQLIGCKSSEGFRSRNGIWASLIIAKSAFKFIEIPKCRIEECLIEGCSSGKLEARDIDVSGSLHLNGSSFESSQDGVAVELREARIGRSLRAIDGNFNGQFSCPGSRIGSELLLDGSAIGHLQHKATIALDLGGAVIDGPLGMCARTKPFRSRGSIKLTSVDVKALLVRGADINGFDGPSIIADGITVRGSVMLGGSGDFNLVLKGSLRFVLSGISGQFELTDVVAVSDEYRCLVLDSSRIGGDVIIGHPASPVRLDHAISANSLRCDGRMMFNNFHVKATDSEDGSAVSIRESNISGGLLIYDGDLTGCLNIDHTKLGGLSLHRNRFGRAAPVADLAGLPERYAHESDALISAMFAEIGSDLFMDDVVLEGGDMRLAGATLRGVVRFTRTHIRNAPTYSLVMQNAKLEGGINIAGTATEPCQFDGSMSFIGAIVGSSVTLSCVRIGNPDRLSELALDGSKIAADVFLDRVEVHGRLGATSASIGGNLNFYGTLLSKPDGNALHATGASIGGTLDLAAADMGSEPPKLTVLDGTALFNGIKVGSFRWKGFEMLSNSRLFATDMIIERSLDAAMLRAGDDVLIDLAGTEAGQLIDRLGDRDDGWGAGKAKLGLDGFGYQRILRPSGYAESDARLIRTSRKDWLQRRSETSSTRSARQLAKVLHEQGLYDASRLILMDAFSEEGKQTPTYGLEALHGLFGLLFGHGFSGGRAFLTIITLWLVGAAGIMALQSNDFLVQPDKQTLLCEAKIDPFLYAGDALLPVVDLGEESRCDIGGVKATAVAPVTIKIFGIHYDGFGRIPTARFLFAVYKLMCWIALSLAILTWSGVFKRSGRA